MDWPERLARLRARGVPCALVTVASVRGHAPRAPGAKMLVTADATWGSVGGGDLEEAAVRLARERIAAGAGAPETMTRRLVPSGGEHGLQCCGGEVELWLEPFAVPRPLVATFGAGHVGRALLHVLAPLPWELRLIDARAAELAKAALPGGALARLDARLAPSPESEIERLPPGAAVLVMTHDHAEDAAIVDAALRRVATRDDLAFLGLIGSSVKWARLRARLAEAGHPDELLGRVTTPIGVPGAKGKRPAAIAIAVAAQLLGVLPEG